MLVQRKFRGNVVFIGEYIIGKDSTIPRALVVNLTKRPDGKVLDKYQRHQPLLVSTFYYFFIQWYVDHFDDICCEIDKQLTKFREMTDNSDIHGRLRDTKFYLQTSYMIFLEFCRESGFITSEDALDEYRLFCSEVTKLIQEQQARFETGKPKEVDYLKLIKSIYNDKKFHLADDIERFDPDKHDGLFHYGCLCLRGERLDKKIRKAVSGYEHKNMVNQLLSRNALKLVKRKHTVQIKGLRFYAIKLDKLS